MASAKTKGRVGTQLSPVRSVISSQVETLASPASDNTS